MIGVSYSTTVVCIHKSDPTKLVERLPTVLEYDSFRDLLVELDEFQMKIFNLSFPEES